MNILGYPHTNDGAGYYRLYQPLKQLGTNTDHTVMCPPPGWTWNTVNPAELGLDLIVGQRMAGREGLDLWQSWRPHAGLIYETDDDILRPPSSLPQYRGIGSTIIRCLQMADLVTTSTPRLAERLARHNPNVAVLPNHVHEDLLTLERPRRDRLTVGWAGGHTHHDDWHMIAAPVRDALSSHHRR